MLLTITCGGEGARDLSWLLHKRPDRFQAFNLPYGKAYVFFPEYSEGRASACLLLDADSESLNELCKAKDGEFQYVNPRRFLSGSLLSAAISRVFSSAMRGLCAEKPELISKAYDFVIEIPDFSCRLRPEYLERLLAPLGWEIKFIDESGIYSERHARFGNLRAAFRGPLKTALSQLFILLPVFDRKLHFWLGEEQLDKFIREASGWLEGHPEKALIINEYFRPAPELRLRALERFGALKPEEERGVKLSAMRHQAIARVLLENKASSVIDLGCGNGAFLSFLAGQKGFAKTGGMDIKPENAAEAGKRLYERSGGPIRGAEIFIGSLTYPDSRLDAYEAAVLSEVIEHFEPERMDLVMKNILGCMKPRLLVMTTPNKAYNALYNLREDESRHPDHRHEFDTAEFAAFCQRQAALYGYEYEPASIGESAPLAGAPSLMGVFKKCA